VGTLLAVYDSVDSTSPEQHASAFSSERQMSILFNDRRFNTGARPRSRSSTGLWLSVVAHVTFAGVLMTVVPTRASEKTSAQRPGSMPVFRWAPTEPVKLRSIPVEAPRRPAPPLAPPVHKAVIAEVPKPAAITPIAAKPVQPAPTTLPPAAAPAFERPVEAR